MIIPINIRMTNGSFTTTIPKPMCIALNLDELLKNSKNVKLIAEFSDNCIVIRIPTEEESSRFGL